MPGTIDLRPPPPPPQPTPDVINRPPLSPPTPAARGPVGLVLSGGGTRGDFELGACRWLYDNVMPRRGADARPDLLAGTSTGSVNSGKLAEGGLEALAELEEIWFSMRKDEDFMVPSEGMKDLTRALDQAKGDAGVLGLLLLPLPIVGPTIAITAANLGGDVATIYKAIQRLRGVFEPEPIRERGRATVNAWSPSGPGHTGPGFAVVRSPDGYAYLVREPDDMLRIGVRDRAGVMHWTRLATDVRTSPSVLPGAAHVTVAWANADGLHWIERAHQNSDFATGWSGVQTIAFPPLWRRAGAPVVFDEVERTVALVLRRGETRRLFVVHLDGDHAWTEVTGSAGAGGVPDAIVDTTTRRWLAVRGHDGELLVFSALRGNRFAPKAATEPKTYSSTNPRLYLGPAPSVVLRTQFAYHREGTPFGDGESEGPWLYRTELARRAPHPPTADHLPVATSNPAVQMIHGEPHVAVRDEQRRLSLWRPGHPRAAWPLPPDGSRARHAAGDPVAMMELDGSLRMWIADDRGAIWTRTINHDWECIDARVWSGPELLFAITSLEQNRVSYIDGAGFIDHGPGLVSPLAAVMASCVVPVVFPPVTFLGRNWLDGGMRSVTPIRPVLDRGAERIYAVVASSNHPGGTPRLLPSLDDLTADAGISDQPPVMVTDWKLASILEIGVRSAFAMMPQAVLTAEVEPATQPWPPSVTIIQPSFELHEPNIVHPGMIRIAYSYGWMRAADVVAHHGDPRARESSDAIIHLRAELLELENRYFRRFHRLYSADYDPDNSRDSDPQGRTRPWPWTEPVDSNVAEQYFSAQAPLLDDGKYGLARVRRVRLDHDGARADLVTIRSRKFALAALLTARRAAGFALPPGSDTVATTFEAHRWTDDRIPPLWGAYPGSAQSIFSDIASVALAAATPPPPP